MGSKTQIALPDLEDGQAEIADSAPRPEKQGVEKTQSGQSRITRSGQAEIIPAFLPSSQPGNDDKALADGKAPGEDIETGEEDGSEGLPPAAGASLDEDIPDISDAPAEHGVEDPELIELLEQLSATIDNANLVLSEAPPLRRPVADEYAAAGIGSPETPPEAAPDKPARGGAVTGMVLSGVFLCAVAGGYWWFKTNPWLLDGPGGQDTAMSLSGAAAPEKSESRPESVEVKLPQAPRAAEPPRGAEQERVTASLTPPAAAPQVGGASTASEPETAAAAQPAKAPAGGPIEIDLALPGKSDGQEISVMIQGVPKGVTLSSGSFIGGGTWVLTEQEAANLVLNTPASFNPQAFAVDVVFVKSDGKVPESRSIDVVVEPASAAATPAASGLAARDAGAPSPAAPAPANVAAQDPASGGSPADGYDKPEPEEKTDDITGFPAKATVSLSKEQEQKLLARGAKFMEFGDVASARLIYAHAARLGSKAAMLAMGKSFDSKHLASLGVRGVQPDQSQAIAWYERASRQADR